jgi:DNA polymerase IV
MVKSAAFGPNSNSLHHLPVELMWGVGPVSRARLAEIGVLTIGQPAKTPGWSLERLLGPTAGEKLAALAWNRDPREIETHRRAGSVGAQSAIGRKPAESEFSDPPCCILQTESALASGPSPGLVEP